MSTLERLPAYLRKYVVAQDYDAYTSQEHATWRYIMRQSRSFLGQYAVDIYVEGLKRTGIPIDRIPRIDEMDRCLNEYGWGAVGVEGFIPSSVFLDLLARAILPIATDMRTIEHIGYTPAPDIVHEAAGHAPVLADAAYRRFLERYSHLAYRALISAEDIVLYEAIRYLSDIKENPDTAPGEVERANERLKNAAASMRHLSEAGKVARLAWWTIEYGLVGDANNPRIYGAGLLSSIAESQACLSAKVKKIPLTLACVNQTYDITEPQPQLFIARTMEDLPRIVDELEGGFAFKLGGRYGLDEMQKAQTINTIVFEQGVSASGVLKEYIMGAGDRLDFFKLEGPTQLSFEEKEIPGQGRARHHHGFSSPVGRWQTFPQECPSRISDAQLSAAGFIAGKRQRLKFLSGFEVEGILNHWERRDGRLLLLTWTDCRVTRGETLYFDPAWGEFDMLVGEQVVSVFAGPADRLAFGNYYVGEASTSPGRSSAFSDTEKQVFSIFDHLRQLRGKTMSKEMESELEQLARHAVQKFPGNWLIGLEIAELAAQKLHYKKNQAPWLAQIYEQMLDRSSVSHIDQELIAQGLRLVNDAD